MLWELSENSMIVSFTFLCTASFICGWLADRIMECAGFGVIGNWLLLFLGAFSALYAYNLYGMTLTYNHYYTIAAASIGGTFVLVTLAAFKAATHT